MSKGVLGSFGGCITDNDGFDGSPTEPDMEAFAIPSTSGTGSEISDGVVVIDEQRNNKQIISRRKGKNGYTDASIQLHETHKESDRKET